MKRFAATLTFVIGVASASGQERPNILFFLSDDQRFDQMEIAGHPVLETPTMDRLAAEGVRFTNAFVTTSICAASRATILTGLYDQRRDRAPRNRRLAVREDRALVARARAPSP